MTLLGRLRAYYRHDDPAAETANVIALIVGWNGPFYPLYVVALTGRHSAVLAPLTMLATPLFLGLPWLSRRSSTATRFGLVLVGTANTLWCMKLLSAGSGVELFLLPCVVLAALLFRKQEQAAFLAAVALPLVAYVIPLSAFGVTLIPLSAAESARLCALNMASVLVLAAVLATRVASLLRRVSGAAVGPCGIPKVQAAESP